MFGLYKTHRARLRATVFVGYPACWFSVLIKRAHLLCSINIDSSAHPLRVLFLPVRLGMIELQSLSLTGVDPPKLSLFAVDSRCFVFAGEGARVAAWARADLIEVLSRAPSTTSTEL